MELLIAFSFLVVLAITLVALVAYLSRENSKGVIPSRSLPGWTSDTSGHLRGSPRVQNNNTTVIQQNNDGFVEGLLVGELLSSHHSDPTFVAVPVEVPVPVETFQGDGGQFGGGGASSDFDAPDTSSDLGSNYDGSGDFGSSDSGGGSDFGGGGDFSGGSDY